MRFLSKHEVYRDLVSGVFYEKEYTFKPIALIPAEGRSVKRGIVLRPFMGHPDLDFSHFAKFTASSHPKATLGYSPNDFSQTLFVTADVFTERFAWEGVFYLPVDLDASRREYEEENCDFTRRDWILRNVERTLKQSRGALSDCVLYTLYEEYKSRTICREVDSYQLSLFPD